ncbi:MAG: uracil-DNA glycosylase family protein [Mesorhizobium sp.]
MDSGLPDLRELLLFYADAGADEALEDSPVDRFAESASLRRQTGASGGALQQDGSPTRSGPAGNGRSPGEEPARGARSLPPPARPEPIAAIPDEAQAARARELARSAGSMEELRELLASFDGCNLKSTAKTLVFADGNPQADIMFVGEAPGRDEDLEGLPFVGRSGRLLDLMLAAIGLDRSRAYIANVIPWRPPGNRTPTPIETEICRPFIERQVELANPKVLVTLGGPSAKVLLHASEGVLRMRGTWKSHTTASGVTIPAMPTLHPAYLLRNPSHKRLAWRDFLEIKAKLREIG